MPSAAELPALSASRTVPATSSRSPGELGDFKAAVAQAENEKASGHLVSIAAAGFFSTMFSSVLSGEVCSS
jgi:hypothetical protein